MIREITGVGEGKGPVASFHDGFGGFDKWAGFLSGADRIAIGTSSHYVNYHNIHHGSPIAFDRLPSLLRLRWRLKPRPGEHHC